MSELVKCLRAEYRSFPGARNGKPISLVIIPEAHVLDAADTIERLTAELTESRTAVRRIWNNRQAEVERLREALEAAPHGSQCAVELGVPPYSCDCWKSRLEVTP